MDKKKLLAIIILLSLLLLSAFLIFNQNKEVTTLAIEDYSEVEEEIVVQDKITNPSPPSQPSVRIQVVEK